MDQGVPWALEVLYSAYWVDGAVLEGQAVEEGLVACLVGREETSSNQHSHEATHFQKQPLALPAHA